MLRPGDRQCRTSWILLLLWIGMWVVLSACGSGSEVDDRSGVSIDVLKPQPTRTPTLPPTTEAPTPEVTRRAPPTLPVIELLGTPTPDLVRDPPELRDETAYYQVKYGDSLNVIANRFQVAPAQIIELNNIANQDVLSIGVTLVIPPPLQRDPGPTDKIIPNSELVYGPASIFFDVVGFVESTPGYLRHYREVVDGEELTGAEIVIRIAQRYSVNPMLLLAVLEHQGSWLYRTNISTQSAYYPIGYIASGWEGLYAQLAWAADQLNTGYYRWRAGWAGPYTLTDGATIVPGAGVNAGTVGVQYFFSQLSAEPEWRRIVSAGGFEQVYAQLFGNPFTRQVAPLVPQDLIQPDLQLPIEEGKFWSFTGGPHSAWGGGAAWAALDFAPPGFALGCVLSDEWIVASAPGLVVRTGEGEVLLDLDGDGYEQSGWVLFYLHVEERDRVAPGTYLEPGDRIGHPSCEGGVTTGTHLHLARKFNGEWISADGFIPFEMDDWTTVGTGDQYDGWMVREGEQLEACACRNDMNQISR